MKYTALFYLLFLSAATDPIAVSGQQASVSKGPDGNYRFNNDRYAAVINPRGRLESLTVEGEEFLSPPTVHANAYGAALVGGPEHRTAFDLPDVRIEAGLVVARGDGRELSYRFLPDGIDFLFDLPAPLHWVLHLNPRGVAYLAQPDRQIVLLPQGGPVAGILGRGTGAATPKPTLFVHSPWVGRPGAPDAVIAGYCNLPAGKSEASLRFTKVSGWTSRLEIAAFAGAHDDHLFPRGEPVRFDLRLRNHSDQPFTGRAVIEVSDHAGFAKAQTFELPVRVDGHGQAAFAWRMQPDQPFVARAVMRIQSGEEVIGSRDFVFVYDAEHYRPPLTRPADFHAFWQATLKEMRDRPLELHVTPAPELSNAHKAVSLVAFTGLEGRRIEGWLVEPTAPGKYAAVIGSRVQNYPWPKPGPDERPDRVSLVMKLYQDGLYNSGLARRETAEFRHVYADHVRAFDVLLTRATVDPRRIAVTGASRTGPAALAAAALEPRLALVDIHVPTSAGISWPSRFYEGWGAGGSRGKPDGLSVEAWLQLLGYFDAVNFAPDVKCPVIIGLGLRDYGLSPAPGIIAAYSYLPGERAIVSSPWEGHCYPPKFQQLQAVAWRRHMAARE